MKPIGQARTTDRPSRHACAVFVRAAVVLAASSGGCSDNTHTPDADVGLDAADADDADDGGDEPDSLPPVETLEELFAQTEGLAAVKRGSSPSGYTVYDVTLAQPLDPIASKTVDTFEQRAALYVRDALAADGPVVLVASGYGLSGADRVDAITSMLEAHQLVVEYRYNGGSVPADDPAYTYLDARAAAADLHRYVAIFQRYFVGGWVSVGRSRGGVVALHHRAMHRDDLRGTVAIATPDVDGAPDPRWATALKAIGDASCQQRLDELQRAMLGTRRAELLDLFATSQAPGTTFDRIGGTEAAFEATVLDLSLSYWQSYGRYPCGELPTATADEAILYDLLISSVGDLATDAQQDHYAPYFIIAHRQDGYPQLPKEHLVDLLRTPAPDLTEGTVPPGVPSDYDGAFDQEVDAWIERDATNIVFISGEMDAWGAVRHPTDPERGVVEHVVAGAGHNGAQWESLPEGERAAVRALVESWVSQ